MATETTATEAGAARSAQPAVRTIGVADLKDALAKGLDDYKVMPTHLGFIVVIYPIVMLVVARTIAGYDVLPLVFPLLAGYTLIGPLVAVGMYELSRRREKGLGTSRLHAYRILRFPSIRDIATLGVALMVVYFVWLAVALLIYGLNFGSEVPESISGFLRDVFTTSSGWILIIVGSGAGFVFAIVAFSLSVVSFPLLLDRDISVTAAVRTSIRVVRANPVTMAVWAIIIAAGLLLGSVPFFFGLAVVMPVLGHATWHVYRKTVERTEVPHRRPPGQNQPA